MTTPASPLGKANKVVVAYADGRRLKGFIYDFSPVAPIFHLVPSENARREDSAKIEVKDLKAVFFVKDFTGRPDYHELKTGNSSTPGRKIEVTFPDGETLQGTTQGYDRSRQGFFLVPIDPEGNNLRIFVVNKNVRQVRWV